jgi:hypothetical protein
VAKTKKEKRPRGKPKHKKFHREITKKLLFLISFSFFAQSKAENVTKVLHGQIKTGLHTVSGV